MASYSPFNQYFIWLINYTQCVHLNNTVYWDVCVCVCVRELAERCVQMCEKTCPPFPLVGCSRIRFKKKQQISGTSFPSTAKLKSLCEDQAEDTFSILLFINDATIMTPSSGLVDLVAVSSGSYPAVPDSVQPDSGNLHQGLLRPHLWILITQKRIISSFSSGDNRLQESLHLSIIRKAKLKEKRVLCPMSFSSMSLTAMWNYFYPQRGKETSNCWWANRVMDSLCSTGHPGSSPTSQKCSAQLCMCVLHVFVSAWMCVTQGTSLTELHYAGAAPDLCAFTIKSCVLG